MSEKPTYEELEQRIAQLEGLESEHKQMEQMLGESEEKFRIAFQTNPDAINLNRLHDGAYIEINEGFTKIMGYTHNDAYGKSSLSLNIWANEADRTNLVERLKESGHVENFEAEFIAKDGSVKTGLMSASIIEINGERVLLSVTKDITEQKRAAVDREKLQIKLMQTQKLEAIGTLAGGIVHNFNNVLMGIQGCASMMMIGKDSAHPDFEHLNNIETYVQAASELTKEILGFARGGKYEVKPTDLNALIKHESRMFSRTRKDVKIYEKYEEDLWVVEVDQGQIQQVLLNLYVNAWQAMPRGGSIYVRTENVLLDEAYVDFEITSGKYSKVSVADTGFGMDEDIQEKIYDPFFSTKESGRGSGLGLASVYGIVKNHGGYINVASQKGKGTTFSLYFPASVRKIEEVPSVLDPHEMYYGHGSILLVDDEEMIISVGKKMLERLGYQVRIARSGQEALNIYEREREAIDLVIMDMIMPHMGGGEIFDRLKEIDENVRVLLSSGYSLEGEANEIMGRGCMGFIQKPFSLNSLSLKTREVLRDKEK